MKKIVLKLEVHDDKSKQKAMKVVSSLEGVDSIAMDMKEKKLTVIGDVDPVEIVEKLRKKWHSEILTIGPKEEPKKQEAKKEEPKKEQIGDLVKVYPYNPHLYNYYYNVQSMEENPNGCVIT